MGWAGRCRGPTWLRLFRQSPFVPPRIQPRAQYGTQRIAQLAGVRCTEARLKLLLRLPPERIGRLEFLSARRGQLDQPFAAIGARPIAEQPIPLEKLQVAAKRRAVHRHHGGQLRDGLHAARGELVQDRELSGPKATFHQHLIVGSSQIAGRLAQCQAVAAPFVPHALLGHESLAGSEGDNPTSALRTDHRIPWPRILRVYAPSRKELLNLQPLSPVEAIFMAQPTRVDATPTVSM